jgi:hypothetical protein
MRMTEPSAPSGTVLWNGRMIPSCEGCARVMRRKWFAALVLGECSGCGCMLDPLWDSRTDID